MKHVADPAESQKLLHGVGRLLTHLVLKMLHPGLLAAGEQLLEDYDFDGIELCCPRLCSMCATSWTSTAPKST